MAAPLNAGIRDLILESCEELLKSNSFANISLAAIAGNASVSKGTLHYYYPSKDELLFDVTGRYLDRLAERLLEWTGDASKDTSYKRLVRYVVKCGVDDQSGSMRLHLIAAAVSGNEDVRQKLLQKYRDFKSLLARKITERRPGADGDDEAWMLLLFMDGLLIQNQLQNPDITVDGFVEKAIEVMDSKQGKQSNGTMC